MSLQFGQKLAHYEIVEPIGKGGMGEVFRARDGKLGRDVAIKVLPEEFATNEDRLGRFQREAKVLASLNHPNIAAIYGLERSKDTHYLVLELVEGETLAERLTRGPIPLDEAVETAGKIAEALEEAHVQGIVHRDLKPANVKLTPDGNVKVLDFGLAKAFAEESPDSDLSMSPTMTRDSTRVGVILGTAAYMSPEQAKGRRVDKRTDIFAFGAVLYEMLTGKKAFPGDDVSEVLASVIKLEPDWDALDVPPRMAALIRRCLEKDPKNRRRDIGDVKLDLEESVATEAPATTIPSRRGPMLAVGILVGGVLASLAAWSLKPPPAPRPLMRFEIALPRGDDFSFTGRRFVAISPSGSHIVYGSAGQLHVRAMEQMEPTALRGTEGARTPIFSPDGRWVGFWADGAMKKVSLEGGTPVTLCDADEVVYGASWSSDDTIYFGQGPRGVFRVSANGGEAELVAEVDEGQAAYGPELLPGGKHLLFAVNTGKGWYEAQIEVQSLETGERKILIQAGADARYVPTGHLVYAVAGTLMAVRFDPRSLELESGPVPILEGVMRSRGVTGSAQFSFSDSGVLVYAPGDGGGHIAISWVDRTGAAVPLTGRRGNFTRLRLSPDGTRLAVWVGDEGASDIWILDIERDTFSRLTTDGRSEVPLWSPDGEWVVFSSSRENDLDLYRKRADFSGSAERLLEMENRQIADAWSRDGNWIVYSEFTSGEWNLWMLRMDGERVPRPFLETPFEERAASLSPDGRWIAYQSDESGRTEIYAQSFPEPGRRVQISTDGGFFPVWSAKGNEIFYQAAGQKMMVVEVATEPELDAGSPRVLFEGRHEVGGYARNYDVSSDGERFVMIIAGDPTGLERQRLHVVLNWHDELLRLVPVE